MKFLDQAKIYIKAGNGGDGSPSFRREKYVEYGGPDGGDGGKGGSIILKSERNLDQRLETVLIHHNAIRKGLNSSRTFSTFSVVSARVSSLISIYLI